MGEILRSEDLSTYIRDLERRVANLESGRQTAFHNLITNPSNDAIERANATWTPVFDVRIPIASHEAVFVRVQAYKDPGVTVGLVRLQATTVTGLPVTVAKPVTSTDPVTPTQLTFAWRIPDLVLGSSVNIQVQSIRSSGSGSVFTYWPNSAYIGLVPNATDDGA
jgi:hypothetical protein